MEKTMYDINMEVDDIIHGIMDEFGLNNDFYGDYYPDKVMHLMSRAFITNERRYDEIMKEIKEIFLSYVPLECEFEGYKWGDIYDMDKEILLGIADVNTDLFDPKTGKCTIDIGVLSIAATININSEYENDFIIDDDAVLYNPNR